MSDQQPAEAWLPRRQAGGRPLFGYRLLVGLLQGLALYGLLYHALGTPPRLPDELSFPGLLVCLGIGPVLALGLGRMRAVRLLGWTVALAALLAIFGFHDAWRSLPPLYPRAHSQWQHLPSFPTALCSAVTLFVAYTLILGGEAAGTGFPPYGRYFELSWRLSLQMILATGFAAVLQAILWAGGALFMLIKLHFLLTLPEHAWCSIPVTSMAFAVGLHLTDVREDFVRGLRSLALALFSWLLPLLVLLVIGFSAACH